MRIVEVARVVALPALLAFLSASTVGCAGGSEVPRSLFEVERMAFVAAGNARLPFEFGGDAEYGSRGDLLVDRFEVSRDDWAHWFGAPPAPAGLRTTLAASTPGRGSWPAFASFDEARELAELRGMRLPSAREWLWVAAGPRALPYPWGVLPRLSVANTLELDLRRPVAVGTFEQGRSGQGCYDLLGNVAEWVELDGLAVGDGGETLDDRDGAVLGGSFLGRMRALFGPDQSGGGARSRVRGEVLPPATRSVDLGLRCVADAREFLIEHAPSWTRTSGARDRLVRLGERWGAAAVPLLEELAGSAIEDQPFAWLLEGARR